MDGFGFSHSIWSYSYYCFKRTKQNQKSVLIGPKICRTRIFKLLRPGYCLRRTWINQTKMVLIGPKICHIRIFKLLCNMIINSLTDSVFRPLSEDMVNIVFENLEKNQRSAHFFLKKGRIRIFNLLGPGKG